MIINSELKISHFYWDTKIKIGISLKERIIKVEFVNFGGGFGIGKDAGN